MTSRSTTLTAPMGVGEHGAAWLERREWAWLGGALALAVVLRVFCWQRTVAMFNDGPIFLEMAQAAAAGDWSALLAEKQHPLYALAVAGLHAFGLSWESAGVAVSVLSGAATVALLYVFLRSAFGQPVANVGALLMAFHPYAVRYAGDVQSDGLYLALFVGGVAVLWHAWREGSVVAAALAGVMAGLAYWTRPEGLGIVVVGGALGALAVLQRRWSPLRGLAWGAALGAATLAFVVPYGLAISGDGGFSLTRKKSLAQLGALGAPDPAPVLAVVPPAAPAGPPAAPAAAPDPAPPAPAAKTPPAAARKSPPAAAREAAPPSRRGERFREAVLEVFTEAKSVLRPEFIVVIALGIFALRGWPGPRGEFVLAFQLLFLVLLVGLRLAAGYVSKRHALPPLVLAFGYAAVGVPILGRGLVAALGRVVPPLRGAGPQAAIAAGLVLVFGVSMVKVATPQRSDRAAVRAAAEWLAAQPHEPGAVATEKLRDAWYAGGEHVELPRAGRSRPVKRMRKAGARYAIFDQDYWERTPGLAAAGSGKLRLLHRVEDPDGWAAVYEVVPKGR